MSRLQARQDARALLQIMPLVMRTVVAQLRSARELPAPAHFPLLMMLSEQPRTLTELAELRGVSLPTISNSITALVQRGWVRRSMPGLAPPGVQREGSDRRVVFAEVTGAGRAALERVRRYAEAHLADVLAPLDARSRRQLRAGLAVLNQLFAEPPPCPDKRRRRT